MFISSIIHAKKIIEMIKLSLQNELDGTSQNIAKIVSTEDNKLSDEDLRTKIKYTTLMKALGEPLGNLQMSERLPEIARLDIDTKEFETLVEFIPLIREYRNSSTHSGYHNNKIFSRCVDEILGEMENDLLEELERFYEEVKEKSGDFEASRNIKFDDVEASIKQGIKQDEVSCTLN
jgi:hypothetical protein